VSIYRYDVARTFPLVTGGLTAGFSSSDEESDDDSSFFDFFLLSPCAFRCVGHQFFFSLKKCKLHTLARISLEEIGTACFALGIADTGFLASVVLTFLATLALTSVLAFVSAFFSTFLSDLAIVKDRQRGWKVEPDPQKFGPAEESRLRQRSLRAACQVYLPSNMTDLEGNFDVIIFGTGLVESIAAA
jgi:hypothetical protein